MAEAELFSEQELTCSICLDLFTDPVSTPCGHNFCQACIGGYWASSPVSSCPLCKREFPERPQLSINRVFARIAHKFKLGRYGGAGLAAGGAGPGGAGPEGAGPEGAGPEGADTEEEAVAAALAAAQLLVWCDVCSGQKQPAVSSCLTCTASYCHAHLQPHTGSAHYRGHALMDPQDALRGRTCPGHRRLLEVFCRTCQTCICAVCVLEQHRTHKTVSVQTERMGRQKQVAKTEQDLVIRIKQKKLQVEELNQKLDAVQTQVDQERGEVQQLLDAVSSSLDRVRDQVRDRVQAQLGGVLARGGALAARMEAELSGLQERRDTLEAQAVSQDHIRFLQSFQEAPPPLEEDPEDLDLDLDQFSVQLQLGEVKGGLAELKENLDQIRVGGARPRGSGGARGSGGSFSGDLLAAESVLSLRGSTASLRRSQWNLKDIKKIKHLSGHKKARVYMEDLTLNPASAYPFLVLSEDRRQLKRSEKLQAFRGSSQRFDVWSCATAREGFCTGRHYWEVLVGENRDWKLGVVSESAQRKGLFDMSPPNGYYCLWWSGSQLRALTAPPLTKVKGHPRLRQVGVFLDVEEGQVTFFNAKTGSEVYSFSAPEFSERMFPLLGTGDKEVPLVLVSPQG